MPSLPSQAQTKAPALWIFAFLEMPYGITSGIVRITLPFLLRQSGFDLAKIGAIIALMGIPSTICFLYAPIVDFGLRRRTWLLLAAVVSGTCLGAALCLLGNSPMAQVTVLLFSAEVVAMLASAATGGLMSTMLANDEKVRVGGWVQAGNLGAGSVAGGLLLMLASHHGHTLLGFLACAIIAMPALAGLCVTEPAPTGDAVGYQHHLHSIAQGMEQTLLSKANLPAMLLLLAPIGSGALATMMSSMTHEYGATAAQLAIGRGFGGGLMTAVGSLCALALPKHRNATVLYALSGLLYGASCIAVSFAPLRPATLVIGLLLANFTRGLAFAFYTGVVLQMIGNVSVGNSSLYVMLNAAGMVPIIYMTWSAGYFAQHIGTHSLGLFDGLASLSVSAAFLLCWQFKHQPAKQEFEDVTAA